jgi:hypothetical protein
VRDEAARFGDVWGSADSAGAKLNPAKSADDNPLTCLAMPIPPQASPQ